MALVALTRGVSAAFVRCELTHVARRPIDLGLARRQHLAYEECLADLGCEVRSLPPDPDLPDCVFIEDAAVVVDELAIVARPGAESRRGEIETVARALEPVRELRRIEPPGTLDGGDVLRMGREIWIGLSRRTDAGAIEQVQSWLEPLGYRVRGVPVAGCLHLKSAVTAVGEGTVLLNPRWIDEASFGGMERIEVNPTEPGAANALWLGPVVYPAGFPRTRERLEKRGVQVRAIDVSELQKAEGGVTCCSLLIRS